MEPHSIEIQSFRGVQFEAERGGVVALQSIFHLEFSMSCFQLQRRHDLHEGSLLRQWQMLTSEERRKAAIQEPTGNAARTWILFANSNSDDDVCSPIQHPMSVPGGLFF